MADSQQLVGRQRRAFWSCRLSWLRLTLPVGQPLGSIVMTPTADQLHGHVFPEVELEEALGGRQARARAEVAVK